MYQKKLRHKKKDCKFSITKPSILLKPVSIIEEISNQSIYCSFLPVSFFIHFSILWSSLYHFFMTLSITCLLLAPDPQIACSKYLISPLYWSNEKRRKKEKKNEKKRISQPNWNEKLRLIPFRLFVLCSQSFHRQHFFLLVHSST